MLSLETELQRLRPLLRDRVTEVLLARERREVFSVYPEVRIAAWLGAMLLATAAGIVLKNNLERIGPLALALGIGVVAVACYAWVWRRRTGAAIADDYVLLLGALLISADAAFVESQFHILGATWHRHFLLLALLHGAGAYAYRSRTLLSLSIAALAAWLGIERQSFDTMDSSDYAQRAFLSAVLVLIWRVVNRRTEFASVFEHFAANLALTGGMALTFQRDTRAIGCLITIALAAAVVYRGFLARRESFVLYGFLYGVVAMNVWLIHMVNDQVLDLLIVVISAIAAIVVLFVIHDRFWRLRL